MLCQRNEQGKQFTVLTSSFNFFFIRFLSGFNVQSSLSARFFLSKRSGAADTCIAFFDRRTLPLEEIFLPVVVDVRSVECLLLLMKEDPGRIGPSL